MWFSHLKFCFWIIVFSTVSDMKTNGGTSGLKLRQRGSIEGMYTELPNTITNTGEETNIPIGYQNPYEKNVDVIEEIERSRRRLSRWRRSGMPIFYEDTFSPSRECFIKLAVERAQRYACMNVTLFKVDTKCIRNGTIHDCLMKGNTAWTREKVLETFRDLRYLRDHVVILLGEPKSGCFSTGIGRKRHKQVLSMEPTCFKDGFGTVLHEILHAMGIAHEQCRLNRDHHVTIFEENVISDRYSNFKKIKRTEFFDYGPYDFYSLMHYSAYAFSKNSTYLRTMKAKNDTVDIQYSRIGQRVDLTDSDKAKIRKLTRCNSSTYREHLAAAKAIDRLNNDVPKKRQECRALLLAEHNAAKS